YNLEVPKYRNMMINSANALIHRLEFYMKDEIEITPEIALKEIEMLARQGKLCSIYVWSHPWVLNCGSEYLLKISASMEEELTQQEKDIVVKIRADINKIV
ncbi:unnamed protein product, partial [marine sediment metagenome]